MTPKQKAIELKYKMENFTIYPKRCALIAIDEIIEFMEVDDFDSDTCYWANHSKMKYWIEVKKEIEAL